MKSFFLPLLLIIAGCESEVTVEGSLDPCGHFTVVDAQAVKWIDPDGKPSETGREIQVEFSAPPSRVEVEVMRLDYDHVIAMSYIDQDQMEPDQKVFLIGAFSVAPQSSYGFTVSGEQSLSGCAKSFTDTLPKGGI